MVARKFFYSIILLALIAFKVNSATLHNYLHHGNDGEQEEQCELCEHAINHQNLEFPFAYLAEIPTNKAIPHFSTTPIRVESLEVSGYFITQFFTRPPPSI